MSFICLESDSVKEKEKGRALHSKHLTILNSGSIVTEKGCWEWIRTLDKFGYGTCNVAGETRAHRASYAVHYGPIPKGMIVCHTCDNPSCINPEHLFVGTHSDNMRDAYAKGRRVKWDGKKRDTFIPVNLAWADEYRIKELYLSGNASLRKLALMYRVPHQVIGRIVLGKKPTAREGAYKRWINYMSDEYVTGEGEGI